MRNILILILISTFTFVNAQTNVVDAKGMFWDAETFFYEKDYKEAIGIYKDIVKVHKVNNANLDYRIGVCYLKGYNDNSHKIQAIPYLERAAKDVTKDYKEGEITETKAHEDAFIYLGDAYSINNELDKSIKAYEDFKTVSSTTDKYYLDIVNRKIETSKSAKKLRALSVRYTLKNLGKPVNNQYANYSAVVSGDESMLVFTSNMKFYEAVFYSIKENGKYSIPKNLNIDAKVEGDIETVGISYDGKTVYVFKSKSNIAKGNIYTSTFNGTKWSELKKLNSNINTSNLERHASPSKDGNTLYFTSNRKGGDGGLDIYKSVKQADGEWGEAVNLGSAINSKFDELAPFILGDNKTLYFSSQGHYYNMGHNDFFMSKLNDDQTWTTPLNFGSPLNTTDNDMFLFPSGKGRALISLATEDGLGDLDIYEVTFTPEENPAVLLTGNLDNKGKEINVLVENDGKKVAETKTDKDGKISLQILSDNITVKFKADEMEDVEKTFDIPKVYCLAELSLDDVKLKHNEIVEKTTNNDDNSEDNNNGTNNSSNKVVTTTTAPAILFGFDKAIPEEYKEQLNILAVYINGVNNILIEIDGYADAQGDETYNLMLTKKRANFVKDYLISKFVDANKLKVKGYGEQYPVSIELNPQSRKYNRRVQFKVIRDEAGKLKVALPIVPNEYKIK